MLDTAFYYHTCLKSFVCAIQIQVGPQSVGYRLVTEGLIFGGQTLTASDIAVKAGIAQIGDAHKVASLSAQIVSAAVDRIHSMLETTIDQVKVSRSFYYRISIKC